MNDEKRLCCPFVEGVGQQCCEHQCAWWDFILEHCSILTIALHGSKGAHKVADEERGK